MISTDILDLLTDEQLTFLTKEGTRVSSQLARAREMGLPATLTLREWISILQRFEGKCAFCQDRPFTDLDHLTPIARGGGTTADNCLPSCKICNSRKCARPIVQSASGNYHLPHKQGKQYGRPKRPEGYLCRREMAKLLGCSKNEIFHLARIGKLRSKQFGTSQTLYALPEMEEAKAI